ncbi:unnamed protein product [Ostreobium quekettii]|uniref:Uncharacterized protein n=1 Tax=Ostreobium quekettii TaxID=121088 RepID=A0A8S1IZF8_9CHLO|nr:unnamed protein product [Ostreobium quekettii]
MHRRVGSWGLTTGFVETPRKGEDSVSGLKISASWTGFSQISCIAQMIFGILLFATSTWYLSVTGRTSGQIIGGTSLVLGAAGLLGTAHQKPQFQTLFIVGMGFMALLTFEFVGQIGRDMEVHCNFAESYIRLAHLEETVVAMNKDHIVDRLFYRLNELDDMMDMVSEGTVHVTELRSAQEGLKKQDKDYLESKIDSLHKHAENMLEHIYRKAKEMEEEHKGDTEVFESQKEARAVLEGHLNNIQKVLENVPDNGLSHGEMTYELYEMLYNALKGGHPDSEAMEAEEAHLPYVKASFERSERDRYHEFDMTNKGEELDKIYKEKEQARKAFELKMAGWNDGSNIKDKKSFDHSLMSSLSALPAHCLSETSHYASMKWGGWALMLSQVMAAYVAATNLVVNPKRD